MRFFNTTGPVRATDHYCIPPLTRFDLDEILLLIRQQRYFVLHAPRQVGKTSYLLALMAYLNGQGDYTCLYVNVETGQAARENLDVAMRSILYEIGLRARIHLKDSYPETIVEESLQQGGGTNALSALLTHWAEQLSKPLVLLIDEIDSLIGDTLISVLRQLQAFLQRIVNGGGRIEREYGLGRKRTDLLILWPYGADHLQKIVLELKIRYGDLEKTISEGLEQTCRYLDTIDTTDGHLIVFDRTVDKPWAEKIFRRMETYHGVPITVWGM